jgi:hypothetical protein
MMKKITQTLFVAFGSLLLLISATLSIHAQNPTLTGKILVRKDFGVIPIGPGLKEPSPAPCGQFYVAVFDAKDLRTKPLAVTDRVEQGRDRGDFYTCNYELKVPGSGRYYAIVGMGGSLLLPEQSRDSVYTTDAWIGGTRSKPPRGYERGFAGKFVTINQRPVYLAFEMTYARIDPN